MILKRGFKFSPYLVAVSLVGLALLITLNVPTLMRLHNLSMFFIAIVITAFFGGWLPSLLALGLSVACFAYFIAPPEGFAMGDPQDRVRLLLFTCVAGLFCFLQGGRAKAEAKVRSLAQRLTLALEGTKLGVWDLNLGTGSVWHSDSLAEIYGRDSSRFAQAYEVFLGYVHVEDRDFVHRTVTNAIENGDEFHIQHRIVLPNSKVRWVNTRARIFMDDKRQPERLVAVTTDITDRPGAVLAPAAFSNAPVAPAHYPISVLPKADTGVPVGVVTAH